MPAPDERRLAIAGRLKAAREQAGLTQAQVAKILGLHRPSVSEIEAGRRRVSAEELVQLGETYGVSVSWLTDTEGTDAAQARLELAARELSKLKKADLDRLLQLLASLRSGEERKG
jgi:transcriptional regulator with XRE-family HTH domain